MVLVDTSVWIDHFRRTSPALVDLLENTQVVCHPFVIGEIACGSLARRSETLELLDMLPLAPTAGHDEARILLELQSLWGSGLGWVDVHLLASAKLGGVRLWTFDRSLADAATDLSVGYSPRA